MKKLLSFCLGVLFLIPVYAQQEPLISPNDSVKRLVENLSTKAYSDLSTHMNLEFYTSAAAHFTSGNFDEAAFKINRVRLEIVGSFNQTISYHFRQSFNNYSEHHSLDNLSSSIEFAYVNWRLNPELKLTVGKQFLALGGYEYYVNPIKVREFSQFNDNVACYQAGVTASWSPSSTQELVFQVLNNRSGEDEDAYIYGRPEEIARANVPVISTINWNGLFADKAVHLRYAASWGQQAQGRNVMYLTAGNVYEKGPVIAYLDLMYTRQGLDSQGVVTGLQGALVDGASTAQHTEYFSAIANFDYRIHPQWNVYVKGAYETAGIYKANGVFEKGLYRTTWNTQACIEFFPKRNSELKIFGHLLYKGHQLTDRSKALGAVSPHVQRVSLGFVYTLPVF